MTEVATRQANLGRGIRLELFTIIYNVVEGLVAFIAGVLSGSPALIGFSFDSAVESVSGGILLWRLDGERRRGIDGEALEVMERRALRVVALTLLAAAAYVGFDAVRSLILAEPPEPSLLGIATAAASLVVMPWLARQKRRTAADLGSAALEAETSQTLACTYLSAALLVGLGLNAAFGWWWADPVAALVITGFLLREARDAWNADPCCRV